MPIALAVLMSFLLAPPVRLLQGWRVPRVLAVIVVVVVAFAAIFSLGGLMVAEVNELASDLPRYQSTLREKIQSLRGATAVTGTLERASEVLQELNSDLNMPKRGAPARATPTPRSEPSSDVIQVEIAQPSSSALQTLGAIVTSLVSSSHHQRDCRDLCNFHSRSKAGFEEPAGPTRRIKGYTAHDRGV